MALKMRGAAGIGHGLHEVPDTGIVDDVQSAALSARFTSYRARYHSGSIKGSSRA
jgi:hypothetical protein